LVDWRFIPCADADGATNMAIDEAILQSCIEGLVPPTLRLYRFVPPAVSIGMSQRLPEHLAAHISRQGFALVRRPTGGRAVLHYKDLTYAFIGTEVSREGGFLSSSVLESYKQISQGLLEALALMGVTCQLGQSGAAYRHLQDCFMAVTGCDLHHEGIKLMGSAQTRRRGCILQHGSVPLDQDPALMPKLLQETPADKPRHLNLFDIAGREIPVAEFEQSFQSGFTKAFQVRFASAPLTDNEKRCVRELKKRYVSIAGSGAVPQQVAPGQVTPN
jgi:lipoyl(octanoyl) transferase